MFGFCRCLYASGCQYMKTILFCFFFSLKQMENVKSKIGPKSALHWYMGVPHSSNAFRWGWFYFYIKLLYLLTQNVYISCFKCFQKLQNVKHKRHIYWWPAYTLQNKMDKREEHSGDFTLTRYKCPGLNSLLPKR